MYCRTCGFLCIQLRQRRQAHPAAVVRLPRSVGIQRIALDVEPIHIGRGRPVFQDMVELEKSPAGMVEHAIQHDPDPPPVRFFEQPGKGLVSPQQRINLVIIMRVVAVAGCRLEDRVESKWH